MIVTMVSLLALAGPMDTCPPSELVEVPWGKVSPHGRTMAKNLRGLQCVDNPEVQLQSEATCLDAANRDALDAALARRQWVRVDVEVVQESVGGAQLHEAVVGRTVGPDTTKVVDLGVVPDPPACTPDTLLVRPPEASFVARMPDGGLVVVTPRPEITERAVPACRCWAGCGRKAPERGIRRTVAVEALDGPILGVVDLPYDATLLVARDVDTTSCPKRP